MSQELIWAFGLALAAIVLFLIEFLLPSAGFIGALSFLAVIGSVIAFFMVDQWWGVASLGIYMVLVPTAIVFSLRVLPYTPIGKRLVLGGPDEEEQLTAARRERERAEREQAQALVGAQGRAVTDLRPVGSVVIEGTRIEALAEGAMIAAGTPVRVVRVDGTQVRVRPVS